MTCASCATRIEKKLNRLDGVTATVNYATEKARSASRAGVDRRRPDREVEKTGYTAALPAARADRETAEPRPGPAIPSCAALRQRLLVVSSCSPCR